MYKKIDGFENFYVNECGEIMNVKTNKRVKTYQYKNGYYYVRVSDNSAIKTITVHRAVAKAFVNGRTECRNVVEHKDGDKANNHYTNLLWVTQSENVMLGYARRQDTAARNCKQCELYIDGIYIQTFKTLSDACTYAKKFHDAKYHQLMKRKIYKNIELRKV